MKCLLITADPEVAAYAAASGVDRIFIDLEILGKVERQGGLNTVISCHKIDQIPAVREAIGDRAELLVRINPVGEHTADEVECVIEMGADIIMVPMVRHADEMARVSRCIKGRCGLVPLVETPAAMTRIRSIASVDGVTEVYIGLNDMHLAMGLSFMFELLSGGLVDHMVEKIRDLNKPFGFGGLAGLASGTVPGAAVLAEHVRLGSTRAILSRAFHGCSITLEDFQTRVDLPREVEQIQRLEQQLRQRTAKEAEDDRIKTWRLIDQVASEKRTARNEAIASNP